MSGLMQEAKLYGGAFVKAVKAARRAGLAVREEMDRPTHVCTDCGTMAKPTNYTPGSIGIEVLLWLCFIVPGVIYSAWRMSAKRQDACPACGGKMVSLETPVGARLAGAGVR